MEVQQIERFGVNPAVVYDYLRRLQSCRTLIAITGEFSSGKTSLVNALLGMKGFLPTGNGECTPVPIEMSRQEGDSITVKYRDGQEKTVGKESIEAYTTYSQNYDQNILSVSIPVDSDQLPPYVHLIDTPGTNTVLKEHEALTRIVLQRSDLVMYVMNATVSNTDLDQIRYVMRYSDDIVFVLTNMDETNMEGDVRTVKAKEPETVNRLIEEAKQQLSRIGIADPLVYPVSSILAFDDDRYIAPIRGIVSEYSEGNTREMMRERIEKQLGIIFEEQIQYLQNKQHLVSINRSVDRKEMEDKIDSFREKLDKLKRKQRRSEATLNHELENLRVTSRHEVDRLIKQQEEQILRILANMECLDVYEIRRILEHSESRISSSLRNKLQATMEGTIRTTYSEAKEELTGELNGLLSDFYVTMDFRVEQPEITDLESSLPQAWNQLEQIRVECVTKLIEVQGEIAASAAEQEQYKESLEEAQRQVLNLQRELSQLGVYRPELKSQIVQGGGSTGKKIGRVIGELADIALILYNPASAAGTASEVINIGDKVKDGIKALSYVQKAVESVEKAGKVDKAQEVKEEIEKPDNLLKRVSTAKQHFDEAGRLIKQSGQGGGLSSLGNILDKLSLGYWFEQIGGAIGEAIDPTHEIYEEDPEYKAAWHAKKQELTARYQKEADDKYMLQSAYGDVKSVLERKRIEQRTLEQKSRYIEERIEEKKRQFEIEQKEARKRKMDLKVREALQVEMTRIGSQAYQLIDTLSELLGHQLNNRLEDDFRSKMDELESLIKLASAEKDEIDRELESNAKLLEELIDYKRWIEQWVGERGSVA